MSTQSNEPDFDEAPASEPTASAPREVLDQLLAPFGLDASDPKFWDKGLSMISGMIDELEAMET